MSTTKVDTLKYVGPEISRVDDIIVMEEPLEIFVDDEPYYVTMRLPGDEIPLALGLCFTEGVINSLDDTLGVNYCKDISSNRINVYLGPARRKDASFKLKQKRTTTTSSCGICGKEIIADICTSLVKVEKRVTMKSSRLSELQKVLEQNQEVFPATGGTHAAGIFSVGGELLSFAEDVGRHNALDKAIGKVLFERKDKEASVVLLSSRLSYEMIQKAARLGAEIVAGASPATSLAVELARAVDLTLVGFLREKRGNIYSCPERIVFDGAENQ